MYSLMLKTATPQDTSLSIPGNLEGHGTTSLKLKCRGQDCDTTG